MNDTSGSPLLSQLLPLLAIRVSRRATCLVCSDRTSTKRHSTRLRRPSRTGRLLIRWVPVHACCSLSLSTVVLIHVCVLAEDCGRHPAHHRRRRHSPSSVGDQQRPAQATLVGQRRRRQTAHGRTCRTGGRTRRAELAQDPFGRSEARSRFFRTLCRLTVESESRGPQCTANKKFHTWTSATDKRRRTGEQQAKSKRDGRTRPMQAFQAFRGLQAEGSL